ncbi:hypothetical protein GCM10008019_43520 [Deinococcus soli (ex Cha et al. 2016)]|nr:hypothetical protein GCM10008019_43520 [Deinococcus soli (ex Cha et al. 2016)]
MRVRVSPAQPAPLYAAGLVTMEWTARGPVQSYAVITRPAAPALAGTFTRMPALLQQEELHAWMTAPSRAARVLARDSRAGDDLTVTRTRVTSTPGTGGFTGY